jgi:drug/metabolite transporter (DMT)-like permease
MTWLIFALLTALFEALKDVTLKHSLRDVPATVAAWSWVFFALPFFALALQFEPPLTLGPHFWLALLAGGSLNVVAISLYALALKSSDLSTTVPMIAFTPLFLLITSPLIVGEFPGPWGVVGIILVVIGSYMLNLRERQYGYLAPYRALLRERGPKLMLGVAFLWSIAANIDKIGLENSSPVFWIASVNVFVALALTPLVLRTPTNPGVILRSWPVLLVIGLFSALAVIFQMQAISLTLVAYVIALKRISIVLGVLFGSLIFQEQGLRERLAGVLVMLAGVLCITLLR